MVAKPTPKRQMSTLARDNAIQVRTIGATDWTTVYGLQKLAPKFAGEMQDDSDLYSGGFSSNIATGQTYTIALEGLRKGELDAEDFTEDAGQAIIRKAGTKTGFANVIEARTWRTDGTGEAYESEFSVEYTTGDGDRLALDSWTATLTSRGEPTEINIPASLTEASTPVTPAPPAG